MRHMIMENEIRFWRGEDEGWDWAVRFVFDDLKFHSNGGQVDFHEVEEWMGDEVDSVLSGILRTGLFIPE